MIEFSAARRLPAGARSGKVAGFSDENTPQYFDLARFLIGRMGSPGRKARWAGQRLESLFRKSLVAAVIALGLAGCATSPGRFERPVNTGKVQPSTLREMQRLDMARGAPILIRIYKEESTLEVWKQDRTGKFALLRSYPICRYSGQLGPKLYEGDRQAPEGFYEITADQLNPFSQEYLSFNIGFPNAFDRSLGRNGSYLMVHGGCKSVGCYAMTDPEMDEIYGLVYEALRAGQEEIQLQAFPFRMTERNLAQHADDPNAAFWEMLENGSDAFERTKIPPTVGVCGQKYVFNASVKDLDPVAPCPPGITS